MRRPALRLGGIVLATTALFTLSAALPQAGQAEKPTFDPAADAKALVADAAHLAVKKNRRVLVVWGTDTRKADLDLHQLLRRGKADKWPFYYDYVITPIDRREENAELAQALGVPAGADGSVLSILDAEGKPLAHRVASEFLGSEGWDAGKLGAFLTEHVVEPQDAKVLMKSALAEAAKENKRLFVHLGAPW